MFVSYLESTVNLNMVANIIIDGKNISFLGKVYSAVELPTLEEWSFESEEKAKRAFDLLNHKINAVIL